MMSFPDAFPLHNYCYCDQRNGRVDPSKQWANPSEENETERERESPVCRRDGKTAVERNASACLSVFADSFSYISSLSFMEDKADVPTHASVSV